MLSEVRITGFRSARSVVFEPGPVCALVGEGGVGKSNLLAAIWRLLEPLAPAPGREDASFGGTDEIVVAATVADGRRISLRTRVGGAVVRTGEGPPAIFLPADLRSGPLVASPCARPTGDVARFAAALRGTPNGPSSSAAAVGLVGAVEAACAEGLSGIVLLVEEPELFLPPQTQRYLYRLFRDFGAAGNQVLYSTHAPALLNVGRLHELVLVEHRGEAGTVVVQPTALAADETFRALSEFDAERSELLLARAALLVEGLTEKLVFPFLFRALGHDPDREGISIVECGGKPNIPLFVRICDAVHVPYVVVHDRDAMPGRKPIQAERAVNAAIAALAGPERTIELVPDFEGVAGLHAHSHKPAHAWRAYANADRARVPAPLAEAIARVLELART